MDVRVAATGGVRYGEHWKLGIEELMHQAVANVLKGFEGGLADIDTLVLSNCFAERALGIHTLIPLAYDVLGFRGRIFEVTGSDAAGGFAVQRAARLVESGVAKRVLVLGVEKMGDLLASQVQSSLSSLLSPEAVYQGQTLASDYALMARMYMEKHSVTLRDLALISVKNHANAVHNPLAQFPFPLTVEQISDSQETASPLRALDAASICDGASALILEKPGKKSSPVSIIGLGEGRDLGSLADRSDLTGLVATWEAAEAAYDMAGIEPADVDVAEVHDIYSIAEMMALEDLGLAEPGQARTWVRKGRTALTGVLPINPSGGLKACGHAPGATGVRQAAEIASQLLGTAGERQVKNAQVGLAHAVGGNGSQCAVTVFSTLEKRG